MPTQAQVRNFVDARLTTLWTNQILPREETYAANHGGRYWQGIITTDFPALPDNPSDGSPTVLEVVPATSRKPTDQNVSWADANVDLGATIPCALLIDVYDGPQGQGFVARVIVRWAGNLYTRAQQSGPETWRTDAWRQIGVGP